MASVKMYKFQSKNVSAIFILIIYCHFKLCYLVNILYIHLVQWNNVEDIKYQRSTQRYKQSLRRVICTFKTLKAF